MEKNNNKYRVLDRMVNVIHKIETIQHMLKAIQDKNCHLRFCFGYDIGFGGEAERIELDLLRGYKKHVIGKLKHRLLEEQKHLDAYDEILTGKKKNKK